MNLLHRISTIVLVCFALVSVGCDKPSQPAAEHDHAEHDHDHGDEVILDAHHIMETLNKGKPSLTKQIGADLQADPPNWDAVAPKMPEYVRLAKALADAEPERGDMASWNTLATAYGAEAEALAAAVEAKDKTAALAAHSAITQSCKPCHDLHR